MVLLAFAFLDKVARAFYDEFEANMIHNSLVNRYSSIGSCIGSLLNTKRSNEILSQDRFISVTWFLRGRALVATATAGDG